jgi:hypothetical protein
MALRYWVGGTGTWDAVNTTNWSASSGGAGGASVPTAVDYATFDAASGGGTVTLGLDVPCQGLDIRGYTGTLDFSTFVVNSEGSAVISPRQDGTATVIGTKTVNLNYSGAVGTRTISLTTAVTEANALNVNVTAGTDTITTNAGCVLRNLNFTGFAGTFSATTRTIYGSLTISSGMTVDGSTNAVTFAATSGVQQITTNGKTLNHPITQNSPGATLQLQDNLTMGSTRTYTLTAGTLDLSVGNRTLSTGLFSSSNSNTRSIAFGTGNITVTGNGATVFTISDSTNLTISGTPTVNLTYSGATGTRQINASLTSASANTALNYNISAGSDTVTFGTSARVVNDVNFTGFSGTITDLAKNFYGNLTLAATNVSVASTSAVTFRATSGTKTITTAGLSFNFPLTFDGVGGTFAFQDALTQGSTRAFTVTNGTVQLKNGATSTVGAFSTSGTNQKFLQSTSPGLQATLSQASGTVDASYLTIQDINATGGATWNAFVNQQNVDAGNNDGWDFGISPIVGSYEYTYQLRSFTQPRRF